MGLLNKLFGDKTGQAESSALPWQELERLDQIKDIEQQSVVRPQIIFKHSTSCGISRMALNMFTRSYKLEEGEVDLYFLDLLKHRDVSNKISSSFQLMHQSPQLIVIKDGKVTAHASHGGIADIQLSEII